MRKHLVTAAFIFTLTIAGTLSANAANGKGPQNFYPPANQYYTPEQWAQARKIFDDNYNNMAATRQELASKREILDRELDKQVPDAATIERLSREIGELRGRMLAARANARSRLAEQGLPTDCYGPCNNGYPANGWYNYGYGPRHHGPRHGGHGPRGYWGCPGMWH